VWFSYQQHAMPFTSIVKPATERVVSSPQTPLTHTSMPSHPRLLAYSGLHRGRQGPHGIMGVAPTLQG